MKYWSYVELNSITNSLDGVPGKYSATTYHWGRMENVNYPTYVTFGLFYGSLWDHPEEEDVDYTACSSHDEGEVGDYQGPKLYKGDSWSWGVFLTNTFNFGGLGEHLFRAFTTTMDYGGKGEQCKTVISYNYN